MDLRAVGCKGREGGEEVEIRRREGGEGEEGKEKVGR